MMMSEKKNYSMRLRLFRFLICVLAVVMAAGCSIKEDRSGCPCRLVLDFSEVDTSVVKSLELLGLAEDRTVFSDMLPCDEFRNEYVCDVSRAPLRVNIWNVMTDRSEHSEGIVIPYGCECPQLYMHSFVADAVGEVWYGKVRLRKNYCRLTVVMEDCDQIPYSFTFRGCVDGYGADGMPSKGDFSCVAYPENVENPYALIPRQLDNSLMLDIDDGTRVVKTFALGEYIAATGYDWSLPDLKDMTIVIDYSMTYIKIAISGWDEEYLYNIVL